MSITIQCEHCDKKIEAPETAGGKWGKCPRCHNKIYVPKLESNEEEELRLAPIDEMEEQRQRELIAESLRVERDILSEKKVPPEESDDPKELDIEEDYSPSELGLSEISDEKLTENIIVYLSLMADGQLEQAEQRLELITPYGQKAVEFIDKVALSEIPEPELADIPSQILSGLIRTLRSEIA